MRRFLFPPEKPWEGAPTLGVLIFLLAVVYLAIWINSYSNLYGNP